MNIREVLVAGQSKANTESIVEYIGGDGGRFAELMKIFLEGEYRLTQRAAWPMSVCIERHPELIKPYLAKLTALLPRTDVHNAVRRNIVRLLQYIDIPRSMRAEIFSLCLDRISDPNETIAVRSFSLTVAAKAADGNADLLGELKLVAELALPGTTAAFRSRFQNTFKENAGKIHHQHR
jgi:hypothetical protein